MIYKKHTCCRVCGNPELIPYLNLGEMPLCNNLATSTLDPIHNQRYPLEVAFCQECGLSQLTTIVSPEVLFSNYVYRSSISKGFRDHCKEMVLSLKDEYKLDENTFHIDIAGNDGTLLEQFKKVLNHKILNIDPAENLAPIAEAAGIPTLTEFWNKETAQKIINGKGYGEADLITATNVFAHVDDVKGFMESVKIVLKEKGILVLEFPYLVDFIENKEFDTVYFEHLSYFSICPLFELCLKTGLRIIDIQRQAIHGGSVRVIIGHPLIHKPKPDIPHEYIFEETLYYGRIDRYKKFSEDIKKTISSFRDGIHSLKGKVAGFAASAKGNTLLNSAGITVGSIAYIVDQTPEKIGKYSPGTRIPIVDIDMLERNPPDYLVILAWNFQKEIIEKVTKLGYKGSFIIPIPEFKILNPIQQG